MLGYGCNMGPMWVNHVYILHQPIINFDLKHGETKENCVNIF